MDHLELLKKGALIKKQERFRDLLVHIDVAIQALQINTFRIHDEDLDSIRETHVLTAARDLVRHLPEARRLKRELED